MNKSNKTPDRREYAIGIRIRNMNRILGIPNNERERRIAVVTGRLEETPAPSTDTPLVFTDAYCAVPAMGGLITPLPMSASSQARFAPEWWLPVTQTAAENYEKPFGASTPWVVVRYNGALIACTVDEAYDRGLRHVPAWGPPKAV